MESRSRATAIRLRAGLLGAALLLAPLLSSSAIAQISAPPLSREKLANGELRYRNSVSVGISAGSPYQRDAYFWGASLGYTRVFHYPWTVTGTIAFDQERDTGASGRVKITNSFTAIATIDYAITERMILSTGIGKGFLDDSEGGLAFTSGDWGTGVSLGIGLPDLPFTVRDSLSLSLAAEWNITQREPVVSADLTFGWGF